MATTYFILKTIGIYKRNYNYDLEDYNYSCIPIAETFWLNHMRNSKQIGE